MKKSEVNAMAERIVNKAMVVNQAIIHKDEYADLAKSELRGMCQMLKVLNIEYEWVFDYRAIYYTGFKIPSYGIDIII